MADESPEYITRICYNTFAWKRPSGAEQKSRSDESFESHHGYGHEEWFFDRESVLEEDGELWKYTFLEGVNRSRFGGRQLAGSTIDVGLFTARNNGEREYVARIRRLQVLDREESETAWARFEANGTVARMARQIEAVDADTVRFGASEGFEAVNVRFRLEDVEYDERFRKPMPRTDPLYRLPMHYSLYANDGRYGELQWSPGDTPVDLRPLGKVARAGAPATIADDVHNRHQNALALKLREIYGHEVVRLESAAGRGRADIEVSNGQTRIVFEVKSELDPGEAIRAAMGQLLEYSFWPPHHSDPRARVRMVVAAPGEITMEAKLYLSALRSELKVPVEYIQTFEDSARIRWQR